MKLSQTTAAAILATMTCANAQVIPKTSYDSIVARNDASAKLLEIVADFKSLLEDKRELAFGSEELNELLKRATPEDFLAQAQLMDKRDLMSTVISIIESIWNSGIIQQIWNSGVIQSIVQKIIDNPQAVINFLKSAFNYGVEIFDWLKSSGILADVFSFLSEHTSGAIQSIVNFLASILGVSTSPATPAPTASKLKARFVEEFGEENFEAIKRAIPEDFIAQAQLMGKRDLVSSLISIFQSIWNSGVIQSIVQKIIDNPQAVINFLKTALNYGVKIFDWLKSSGILADVLNFLSQHTSGFIQEIVNFIASFLGVSSTPAPSASKLKARFVEEFGEEKFEAIKRAIPENFIAQAHLMDKRDFVSTVISILESIWNSGIIQQIWNSGVIQSIVQKIIDNPQAVINFLKSAFNYGVQIFDWLKSSGILADVFSFLSEHTSGVIQTIVNFLASILGVSTSGTTTATPSAPATPAQPTAKREVPLKAKRMMY